MSRQRKTSESAIKSMIGFLNRLKFYSDQETYPATITQVAKVKQVSQTAGSVLKELGIIEVDGSTHKWKWKATTPDRKMALMILDKLLQKKKPTMYTPLFPDMAKMLTLLEEINVGIGKLSQMENNSPQGFTLSEEEKRFKIMLAIAQGYYGNPEIGHLNHVERNSSDIIYATEDLLKQYNEKFK